MSKTPTIREQIEKASIHEYGDEFTQFLIPNFFMDNLIELFEALISQSVIETLESFATNLVGRRCLTKDVEDFPNLHEYERCPACITWELVDDRIKELKTLANKGGES